MTGAISLSEQAANFPFDKKTPTRTDDVDGETELSAVLEKDSLLSTASSTSTESQQTSSPSIRSRKQIFPGTSDIEEKLKRRGFLHRLKRLPWKVKGGEKEAAEVLQRKSAPAALLVPSSISAAPVLKSCMVVRTLEESLTMGNRRDCGSKKTCSVGFDKIYIRRHVRTVGDNPSVSFGPPLSLGWRYSPVEEIALLEEYERSRGPRRRDEDLRLPALVRKRMLNGTWGVPVSVLHRKEDEAYAIQRNRMVSYTYRFLEKPEAVMQTAWRRTKRLAVGTSKKREQEWLYKQARQYALTRGCSSAEEKPPNSDECSDEAGCDSKDSVASLVDDYDDSHLDFGENE